MNGLFEILQNKEWMIMPEFAHGIRRLLEQNLNGHIALGRIDKHLGYAVLEKELAQPDIKEYLVSDGGEILSRDVVCAIDAPFVNVLNVEGPITRNGGACSYGSRELRDMLILAADNPQCCGHIFYINTPGGSAWAKNDFEQAIDYAHSKGQGVLAFVDGMCASAGMYLAALCDERYYMHPKDEIGCIGVMAAFYTMKDGEKNEYSGETYHEIYDPESFDKNKDFRDVANNDDTKQLVDNLKKLGEEFRSDVLKHCPMATDEHLHGKVFAAEEVKGILMDGQMSFNEVVGRMFALHNGNATYIDRGNVADNGNEEEKPNEKPNEVPEGEPMEDPNKKPEEEPEDSPNGNPNESPLPNKDKPNKEDMEENKILAAACGVNELVINEEGTHLAPELIDSLIKTLNADKAEKESSTKLIEELKAQLASQSESNEKEKQAFVEVEIGKLKAENDKALETVKLEKETVVKEVEEKLKGVESNRDDVLETLSKANLEIADLKAKIEELTSKSEKQEQGSPASNGVDVAVDTPVCGMPVYDSSKSPMENHRIFKEYEDKMKEYL